MVKLAAFPKCYMDELCETRTMSIFAWIEQAATLGVDGLEMYPGFFTSFDRAYLRRVKAALAAHNLAAPMFCMSPDFTNPDPAQRRREIDTYRRILDIVAYLGGETCRVLSGQDYPQLTREEGVSRTAECIEEVLHHAAAHRITLVMENHYKDNFWLYPEFALPVDIFLEIVGRINSPWFGVNYDPSNALIAGADPLVLLRQVKDRVVTMHASDRYLKSGTLADLQKQNGSKGYSEMLAHGVIGQGLNDYDAIFTELRSVGFDGWISIEDGVNGLDELRQSVRFLRGMIARYF